MHIERNNVIIKLLFLGYLCLLFYIVFFTPNRVEGDYTFVHPVLVPLVDMAEKFVKGPWKKSPEGFWSGFYGNFFGNILIFIPFGFFLKIFIPKAGNKKIILFGALASAAIEIIQLLCSIGVCDINDVILNSTGTWVGIVLYVQLIRRRKWLVTA